MLTNISSYFNSICNLKQLKKLFNYHSNVLKIVQCAIIKILLQLYLTLVKYFKLKSKSKLMKYNPI